MTDLHPEAIEIGQSKEKGAVFNKMPITDDDVLEMCKNTRLVNISLESTKITDKALEYLATLPNLMYLWLDNTQITGEGFIHFTTHKKLQALGLNQTKVSDETLKIIAQIPRLDTVHLDGTKVTFEGLLAIADNKKIQPASKSKFSAEQLALFQQTQRNLAKKKTIVNISDEELDMAKSHLLAFFKAIGKWDYFAYYQNPSHEECTEQIQKIYQQYATERHHQQGQYRSCSGRDGGTYGEHTIVDTEIISKNRFYIYTNADIFQYRFLMIRQKDNSWRVDDCQIKFENWQTQGL